MCNRVRTRPAQRLVQLGESCACRLAILVVVASIAYPLPAEEPPKEYKHLRIRSGAGGLPLNGGSGGGLDSFDNAQIVGVFTSAGGEPEARGVLVGHPFRGQRWKKTPTDDGFFIIVYYPYLREGDVVPVYDYLYQVTNLYQGSDNPNKGNHWIDLKWLPPDKAPAEVQVTKESFLLPQGGKVGLNKYTTKLIGTERPVDKASAGEEKPVAKLELEYWSEPIPAAGPPLPRYTATVRPGDVLLLGGLGYKVCNVVPKDPKTKVIGWVELDPEPIPKANLVRGKVKFVEPEPVKETGPSKK